MSAQRLYRPGPPLAAHIAYFGYWDSHGAAGIHTSRAVPRGAVTVIIDLDDRGDLDFFASDGVTPLRVSPAFAAGAGVDSYVIRIDPGHSVMTIHFRPAGALAFLGCPLGDLEDALVDLTELWGPAAELLRERLIAAGSAELRVALLEAFLIGRMRRTDRDPPPRLAPLLRCVELDPSMRVSKAQALSGLSRKSFATLFRCEVGLSPKAYLRVRRLQAALRALDAPTRGATIAAELGYFDQSHFVREFRSFTGITPTQYARRRSAMPGHVELGAAAR
ncbi:helix-turn-helix domain-containing protein [Mycobacterium sp. 94-17]|uniref:helix-turn-helix domain-containing protein n=1 Tax=Mycobacterium sp. 94-17 TaxID=2986147 RepID=UPI002D1E7311|nr:helix-turn-helix domain-containing protein [Mycobacterium sp. 94-17]MEB4209415.1 helix-turn-helix domain-containing protein [Mycobacterium sp. 94-17]